MAGKKNTATANGLTVTMAKDKDCKGSVRYAVDEAQAATAPVTNVYVARSAFPDGMPESITVTIGAA